MSRSGAQHDAPVAAVPSPCVDVCRMDPASGLCEGCWRTLDEIAAWSTLDDASRRVVWQRLRERRAQARATAPAPRGEPAP